MWVANKDSWWDSTFIGRFEDMLRTIYFLSQFGPYAPLRTQGQTGYGLYLARLQKPFLLFRHEKETDQR
jgi:hypothetical protein